LEYVLPWKVEKTVCSSSFPEAAPECRGLRSLGIEEQGSGVRGKESGNQGSDVSLYYHTMI